MDKTKLTYKVARKIYDSYRFLVADFKIKNLKKVTNTKKKIVFISQMSNLWINVDDLYNQLSNDDQFETYVLMIPEFDYSKKEFDIQTMNTKIYDFHKNHNHQNTIKAFDQGKWFDLKILIQTMFFMKDLIVLTYQWNIKYLQFQNIQKHVIYLMDMK